MREKEYSVYEKYNLFKNSLSLATPLILTTTLTAMLGGILSLFFIAIQFEELVPVKLKYLWLYVKANFAISGYVNFNGNKILAADVMSQIEPYLSDMYLYLFAYFLVGFIVFGVTSYFVVNKISSKHSDTKLKDRHLRGTEIRTQKEYAKISKNIDGYSISDGVTISREHDTKHIMICGATGSGKTNLIIRTIHAQASYPKNIVVGAKFIIHDLKPDYVQKIYNPDTDLIYNVSDQRSIYFNFFDYLYDENGDLDEKAIINICDTIIPNSNSKDESWNALARNVLKSIITYCMLSDNRTLAYAKKMIEMPADKLIEIFSTMEGLESGIQALSGGENTRGSVMTTLSSHSAYFVGLNELCHAHKPRFKIREWIDNGKVGKLFIINDIANQAFNAPKIAVFISTIIKEIYAMGENADRRVYLYLDEFGSMTKISDISRALVVSRSFGLSLIIATQDIGRVDEVYGKDLRQSIFNALTTKIIMRQTDPDGSEFFSKMIGEKEIEQASSGATIGTTANRDGVSFNKGVKKEFTVLPSEIMELKDFEFFIKQSGVAWAKIQATYIPEVDGKNLNNPPILLCKNMGISLKAASKRTIFG